MRDPAEAVAGAERALEAAGARADAELEIVVKERAARVVAEGEEALERVMLAEMMKAAEAEAEAERKEKEGGGTEKKKS